MERLLSEEDFRFLAAQPGFDRAIARRLRAERRRIFRAYLKQLRRDFHRLHCMARLVVLYSPQDRPGLASVLIRQRLTFHLALAGVYFRLGWNAVSGSSPVSVRGLVGSLEQLRNEILLAGPAWDAA
jgi:hypothetical protein